MLGKCLCVIVALCIVALATAAPTPCRAPEVFEAHVFQSDWKEFEFVRAKLSYDASNERVSIFEEIDDKDHRSFHHHIDLFRERKRFSINLKTNECKTSELKHRFRHFGVPHDAKFHGESEIGSDAVRNAGVLVHLWSAVLEEGSHWFGSVTAHDCMPVNERVNTTSFGIVHTEFYDITLGLSDHGIFIPPKECDK